MRRSGLLLAAVLLALALTPCAGSAATPAQVNEGKRLFTSYCVVCHGETGKGNGPLAGRLQVKPADLADTDRMQKRTDRELYHTIESAEQPGHALAGMPKWGSVLSRQDIRALVAYVRTLHQSKYPTLDYPEIGRGVYEDYCASCHGHNGRGEGVLTKIMPIRPADHTNAKVMDKLSDKSLLNIITNSDATMPFMPAWKGVLTESEIEAVARYIRELSHN